LEIKAGEILDAGPQTSEVPNGTGQALSETKAGPDTEKREDPKLSGRLEILMRREQELLARDRAFKEQEASLQEKLAKIERFEKAKGGNAKEALDLLGLDYNQLSEAILQDGKLPPEVHIKKLEDKLSDLEKQREQDKSAQEQEKQKLQAQAEEKAISGFKTEIDTYLKDNKDRYELTHFWEMEDLVFEVIEEHYTRTLNQETGVGKVLSIKEAADKVEEHLEKKFSKAHEVGKIKALWGAIPKNSQETLAKQLASKSAQQPKTLTNNMSQAPAVKTGRPPEDQRIREIVAKFRADKGL
jgi:hypothetical protein